MSDTPRFSVTRFHHKFVAFSAVGVAMVCVPLVQVLQVQHADLQQLQASRALLDPVSAAVHTQYGLLTHGGLARQVLNGGAEIEPLRAESEQEVTARIGNLGAVLKEGAWGFAQAEARMLAEDWRSLATQVAQRGIDAQQSDAAHRLRVEQTLQVVDLVTLSQSPGDGAVPAQQTAWLASTRLMARLAADIDRLDTAPHLHTRMQVLREAMPESVEAIDRVEDRSRRLLSVRDAERAGGAKHSQTVASATVAALTAQQHLFDTVRSAHQANLATQEAAVLRQRQILMSTMAALAALAAALGMFVWSALRRLDLEPEAPEPDGRGSMEPQGSGPEQDVQGNVPARRPVPGRAERAAPQAETGRLMQRLRDSPGEPTRIERPRLRDQEDSLPPPR